MKFIDSQLNCINKQNRKSNDCAILISHHVPRKHFVISGPKKIPIPLEESATPGLVTGSDHRVPATISSSSGSNGLLQKDNFKVHTFYISSLKCYDTYNSNFLIKTYCLFRMSSTAKVGELEIPP